MQVEGAVWRKMYQPGWQNLAIGHDDDHLGIQRLKQSSRFVIFERFRLVDREVQFKRLLLQRRTLHSLTPTCWFVGLRDNAADRLAFFEKTFKRGNRKCRAAHEDESYSHFPSRIIFLILRLIRSRLRKLR